MQIILALLLAELGAFLFLKAQKRATKPLFFNYKALQYFSAFRVKALNQLYKHYMAFDANLGFRIKANRLPFRFADKLKSKKYNDLRQMKLKNLFEISSDKHGFICNYQGQERDYSAIANDKKIFRILVSGNSVTAGSGTSGSEANWPAILEKILNEDQNFLRGNFEKIIVINSSSLGNNLAQEISKFQNETIFLKPHLVISFSGIIANYTYNGNPLDDIYAEPQKKMAEAFNFWWIYRQNFFFQNIKSCAELTPFFKKYLSEIYPYKNNYIKLSAAEIFVSKIKQFKGICDSHNIDFLFIFQPAMGIGKKKLSAEEELSKKFFKRYFFTAEWEDYLKVLKPYCDAVRKNLNEKYQHDFMDIFENIAETVYLDPRHLDNNGHKIVAEEIANLVKNRN